MQIRNESRLPPTTETQKRDKNAAFNGQLGIVTGEYPAASYKYRRGEKGRLRRSMLSSRAFQAGGSNIRKEGRLGVDQNLELAYAITIHKAQGSQFQHVFLIVPEAAASFFGRELHTRA